MKRRIKTVLFLGIAACLSVLAVAFAACDNSQEENGGTTTDSIVYTITVVDEDGTPFTTGLNIANEEDAVSVQLCLVENGVDTTLCLTPVAVDSNGTAEITVTSTDSYSVDTAIFHIQLNNVESAGYTYDLELYTSPDTLTYTVVVTPDTSSETPAE